MGLLLCRRGVEPRVCLRRPPPAIAVISITSLPFNVSVATLLFNASYIGLPRNSTHTFSKLRMSAVHRRFVKGPMPDVEMLPIYNASFSPTSSVSRRVRAFAHHRHLVESTIPSL